jgi:MFS superfamily sulfate permease-like transporter
MLVGYAEALGAAKAAVMQDGGDIDPNQELIAHGPANILSGLFGGFLVVGSLSKTSVGWPPAPIPSSPIRPQPLGVCPRSDRIAGELALGVPHAIALGVALSLLMLIYRTSHPQGAVLGQLPGTEAYRDVRRHPEAITFPGLLIWRVGGDLFFASVGHLDEGVKAALAASRPPANHVLVTPIR